MLCFWTPNLCQFQQASPIRTFLNSLHICNFRPRLWNPPELWQNLLTVSYWLVYIVYAIAIQSWIGIAFNHFHLSGAFPRGWCGVRAAILQKYDSRDLSNNVIKLRVLPAFARVWRAFSKYILAGQGTIWYLNAMGHCWLQSSNVIFCYVVENRMHTRILRGCGGTRLIEKGALRGRLKNPRVLREIRLICTMAQKWYKCKSIINHAWFILV